MKKLKMQCVNKFGEDSISHVEKQGDTYLIKMDCDGTILAYGKEIKGYFGDVIRVMYPGYTKYDADYYILESDRHGAICHLPYGEPWERYVK